MTDETDRRIAGGILAVLGLVAMLEGQLLAGFFLLGLGVVIMASTSEEIEGKLLNFFFSIFKELWEILKRMLPL